MSLENPGVKKLGNISLLLSFACIVTAMEVHALILNVLLIMLDYKIFSFIENTIRVTYHGNLWIAALFRSWTKRNIKNYKPWFLRKCSLCGTRCIRSMEFGLNSSRFESLYHTRHKSAVWWWTSVVYCVARVLHPRDGRCLPIPQNMARTVWTHFSKWHFLDVGESWHFI